MLLEVEDHLASGRIDQALGLLGQHVDNPDAHLQFLLSRCFHAQNDASRALDHAVRACTSPSVRIEYLVWLTDILWECGAQQQSVLLLNDLFEQTTSNVDFSRRLVQLQRELSVNQLTAQQASFDAIMGRVSTLTLAALKGKRVTVDTLEHYIVGGLAIDAALLPKVREAGEIEDVLFFSGKPANEQLLKMLGRMIPVIRDDGVNIGDFCDWDPVASAYSLQEQRFKQAFFGERYANHFDPAFTFIHSTNGRTFTRPNQDVYGRTSQIEFTNEEEERALRYLEERMGIPRGAWFVCIYARDSAFYNESVETPKFFRNSDISKFDQAISVILQAGGHVVRMGSLVEKPFSYPDRGYVDYATTCRDDFIDIYLAAKCKFFMGTYSGLSHVPFAFKTPLLNVNTVNFVSGTCAMHIPKKVKSFAKRNYISFFDAARRFYSSPAHSTVWEDGIGQRRLFDFEYEENSPEELADAAGEMLKRLSGEFEETAEDALLRERYHSIWSAIGKTAGLAGPISAAFLRRNRELIGL